MRTIDILRFSSPSILTFLYLLLSFVSFHSSFVIFSFGCFLSTLFFHLILIPFERLLLILSPIFDCLSGQYMLHGVNTPTSSNSSIEATDSPVQQRRRGNGDNPSSSSSSNPGLLTGNMAQDTIAIDVRNSYNSTSSSTLFTTTYNAHADFHNEKNIDNA